jgi:small conductance mechanosensitive channel
MLLVFKPFKAGDWIEAQGVSGTVMEVNITATKILTVDNRVIILPNGALSNGTIDNYSARPLRRVDWTVSVAYGSDAEGCRKTIIELLAADKRVLQADTDTNELYKEFDEKSFQLSVIGYKMESIPAPVVFLKSLNESDITFSVRAWVRGQDYWDVYFKMNEVFYTELPKHGYEFAFPHMDVTMLKTEE